MANSIEDNITKAVVAGLNAAKEAGLLEIVNKEIENSKNSQSETLKKNVKIEVDTDVNVNYKTTNDGSLDKTAKEVKKLSEEYNSLSNNIDKISDTVETLVDTTNKAVQELDKAQKRAKDIKNNIKKAVVADKLVKNKAVSTEDTDIEALEKEAGISTTSAKRQNLNSAQKSSVVKKMNSKDIAELLQAEQSLNNGVQETTKVVRGTVNIVNQWNEQVLKCTDTIKTSQQKLNANLIEVAEKAKEYNNGKVGQLDNQQTKSFQKYSQEGIGAINRMRGEYFETVDDLRKKGYADNQIDKLVGVTEQVLLDITQKAYDEIKNSNPDKFELSTVTSKINYPPLISRQDYEKQAFLTNPKNIEIVNKVINKELTETSKEFKNLVKAYRNLFGDNQKILNQDLEFSIVEKDMGQGKVPTIQGAIKPQVVHIPTTEERNQEWFDTVTKNNFHIEDRTVSKKAGNKIDKNIRETVKEYNDIMAYLKDFGDRIKKGSANIPTDEEELKTFNQQILALYQRMIELSSTIPEMIKQANHLTIGKEKKTFEETYMKDNNGQLNPKYQYSKMFERNGETFGKGLTIGTAISKYLEPYGFKLDNSENLSDKENILKYLENYTKNIKQNIKAEVVRQIQKVIGARSFVPSEENLNSIISANINNNENLISNPFYTDTNRGQELVFPNIKRPWKRRETNIPTTVPESTNILNDLTFSNTSGEYNIEQSLPELSLAIQDLATAMKTNIEVYQNSNGEDNIKIKEEFKQSLREVLLSGNISNETIDSNIDTANAFNTLKSALKIGNMFKILRTEGNSSNLEDYMIDADNGYANINTAIADNMDEQVPAELMSYINSVMQLLYSFLTKMNNSLSSEDSGKVKDTLKTLGLSDIKEVTNTLKSVLLDTIEYARDPEDPEDKMYKRFRSEGIEYFKNLPFTQEQTINPSVITNDTIEENATTTKATEDLVTATDASTETQQEATDTIKELAEELQDTQERIEEVDDTLKKVSEQSNEEQQKSKNQDVVENNNQDSGNNQDEGNNGGNPPTPPTPPSNSDLNAIEDDLLRKLVEKSMRDFAEVYNKGIKEDVKFNLKTSKTYGDEDTEDKNEIVLTLKLDNGLKQTLQYDITSSDTGEKVFNLTNNTVTNTKYGDERDKQNNKLSSILTQVYKKKVDYLGGKDINNNDYQGKKYITADNVRADFETRISTLEQYINDLTNKDQIDTNKLNEEIRILDTTVKSLFDDMDKAYKTQDKIGNVEQNTLNAQISEVEKATKEVDDIKDKVDTILKEVDKKNAEVNKLLKDAENSKSEVEKNSADKINSLDIYGEIDSEQGIDSTYKGKIIDLQEGGYDFPKSFHSQSLQNLLEQADSLKTTLEYLNKEQIDLLNLIDMTTDDDTKQQLTQTYKDNKNLINDCKKQYIEYTEEYVRRGKQIISIEEQVGNAIAETNEQHKQENIIASSQKKITNLKGRLDRLMYNNSKAFTNADYQADADKIYALLNSYQSNADYLDKTKINAAEQQLAKLNLRIQQNNVSGKSLGKTLNELWGRWSGTAMVGMAFRKGLQFIHQMWNAVKEVDKAMTELRKVTDEVGSTYDRYLRTAGATAKELGVSLSDIVNSTADFARLGYSLTESADLSKVATVYKNVADGIDIGTATSDIVSAMKAFSISAEDAMSVADMYNEVGNNFAISSAGIGQALTRSAASLQAAGNSLSESIALVTAGNEILQDPETMGTALKVISLRIRGASADLEDMGESTDDLCDSTSKLRAEIKALSGVDIMLDEETFKSTYQILKEISAVYNDLTGVSQAALTEKLAGKTRSNALQAILTNFDTAEKAYQTAENSAGSAMRENEKYLDSIAGKMAKISASFQELSNAVLDADWVKPLLDGINNILDGVSDLFKTEWGDYNPFNILTVGASLALGTIEATTDGLGILTVKGKTASEQLENLFSKNPFKNEKLNWSLDILGTTILGSQNFNANKLIDKNFLISGDKKFKDSFEDLRNIFTNYSKINNDLDFSKLTEGTEAYNVCLRQLVDTFPDLKEESAGALIEIIKSNDTLITGTGKAEDNQKALSAAIRRTNADLVGTAAKARAASIAMATLQTIGSMAIGFALGAVVSGIGKLIDDFQHQVENAENRLAETVEKWNQASKSLTEKKNTFSNGNIAEEFVELSKGVSNTGRNIALTSDEYDRYVELSKQLYDLNPQLTHTFDEQGNVLLTFKGNVEQLNKVVNDYFDTLKDENNRKILQEAKDTFKDLNKTISPNYSSWNLKPGTEYLEYKYLLQFTAEEDEVLREQKKLDLDMWAHKVGSDFVFSVSEVLGQGITTLNIYDVISEDLSKSDSKIRTHFNQLEDSLEKSFQTEYKPIIKAKVEINEDFKNFSEDTKSAIYQVLDNIDYDFALDNFMDSGTIDFEGMTEWVTKVVQAFNDNPEISQAIAKSLDIDTKYQNGEISTEEYTKAIAEIGKTFESVDDVKTRSLLIDTAGYEEQINKIEEIFNKATDKVGNYSDDELESFLNSLSKQELEIVYSIINDPESEYESLDALKQELDVLKREKVVISVEVKTNENNFETDYKAYTEKAKEVYDKFDNAIATVSAGNAISLEDMMSLTNLDSSLLRQFTKTADGYVIATDSLTSARERYLKTLETEVRLNKVAAEATQAKLEADLEVLKGEQAQAEEDFINIHTDKNSEQEDRNKALKDFQEKIKAVKATEEEIAKNNAIITKYGILLNDITDPTNKSATAINNLNTALSRLNSTYNTVNNAKIDVATFGHITASNLQSLADTYPELKDDIAEYLASSMSEADNAKLIQAAERAYQKTRDDLKTFFEKELFDSEETYNSWLTNNEEMLGEWLDNNKDIYKADFKNYKTFQELKKALEAETANDGKYITRTNTQGELETYNLSLNDLVDDKGNVTSLYLDLVTHLNPKDENDAKLLQWIKNIVNGYQELKIGVALEGEANEAIDNIEDDHVLSTNPDIEAYKLQLAELEHRQNMGEDVLDELNAKLAEGVQIYSKHKDQFLSDYNSTLERLHNMTNEFYNRDKSIIDHQLEMGEISHREYYNQLTQLYEKYYKGKADFQKEDWQLQEELEKERVSLISEEQSLLQKQKDEIIKYETDAYDTQIKLLQSKIDKNKKISDELSEQNNLLEAQKALLEASQRTKYVYRQGQGFVYERDEEAYYNAKTKYAETLRDIENNALQKKIDALQEASEQSVTIIENFFNNLNDILEEQINPEKANDIGVWNEFFSEDQISALEAILGKKEELKDMYDKGRTVDYNGETYRYIDDDAIARLAENYMPIFMKAYQTELDKTMKLTDTDTLAKTKGFNNTVNKTSYGNSLNQINVQKDAIQIMIQGKVDSQTITDLRNSVYQALDDLVDRMELKAAQERGKQ